MYIKVSALLILLYFNNINTAPTTEYFSNETTEGTIGSTYTLNDNQTENKDLLETTTLSAATSPIEYLTTLNKVTTTGENKTASSGLTAPGDYIACVNESINQQLNEPLILTCADTEVVTGNIIVGRNNDGVCEYAPDGCNGDPMEWWMMERIYTCLWNQSQCSIKIDVPLPDLKGHQTGCSGDNGVYNYITARNFTCVPRDLVHQQCVSSEAVELTDVLEGYIMIPYIFTKRNRPTRNCNVTWISPQEINQINIIAEQMDLPSQTDSYCDSGKLIINATNRNGSEYSCTFCGRQKFSLSFNDPGSVTFDAANVSKIRGAGYRLWFKASETSEPDILPPECILINPHLEATSTVKIHDNTTESRTTTQAGQPDQKATNPPKKPWRPLHHKAPIIWIAFGTILVLLIIIVILIVYIFKHQNRRREQGPSVYENGVGPPRDRIQYTNVNNSNGGNYPLEEFNMKDVDSMQDFAQSFRQSSRRHNTTHD